MNNKISVHDPSFPQVSYDLPLEEVILIIETDDPNYPQWWKLFYKSQILDQIRRNNATNLQLNTY